MNLSNLSIFDLASDRLTWLSARQKVTSENVANAGTPRFQARDITPFSEMVQNQTTSPARLVTTDDRHISSRTDAAPGIREITDGTAVTSTLDGNSVNLEEQTIRAAEISDQYRMAAQIYRKSYDMLTMAVTRSR